MQANRQTVLTAGLEYDFSISLLHTVFGPAVVEPWVADHAEPHLAAHVLGPAYDCADPAAVLGDGHEVGYLCNPLVRQKPREQHVGLGKVELLLA